MAQDVTTRISEIGDQIDKLDSEKASR